MYTSYISYNINNSTIVHRTYAVEYFEGVNNTNLVLLKVRINTHKIYTYVYRYNKPYKLCVI